MPFAAIRVTTGQRFNITCHDRAYLATIQPEPYLCPLCNSKLIMKVGSIRVSHFAHDHGVCASPIPYHPESLHHLMGKEFIADSLAKEFAHYGDITIDRKSTRL